jgi:hypothetical protein
MDFMPAWHRLDAPSTWMKRRGGSRMSCRFLRISLMVFPKTVIINAGRIVKISLQFFVKILSFDIQKSLNNPSE